MHDYEGMESVTTFSYRYQKIIHILNLDNQL